VIFDGQDASAARATYGRIQTEIAGNTAGLHNGRIVFATATAGALTQKAVIDESGNVGIGAGSPGSRLDVFTTSATIANFQSNATNGGYCTFNNGAANTYIGSQKAILATGNAADFAIVGTGANNFVFGTNSAERMRIKSDGEVLIAGTTDQGAYNLQVNGTGVWGAGAYVNGSDVRIKEGIAPLTSGLDVIEKLNPVQFRYKQDWCRDNAMQPGFIAQELQVALEGKDYIDGVVQQGPEYLSVAYQALIPVLTKAIQEQQAQINELKARLAALENA
jgi:hypothetical protein